MENNNFKIINENSVYIDKTVKIGKNVVIFGDCYILGNSEIKDNVTIYPFTVIENSTIGEGSKIYSSFIQDSVIGNENQIGPYARIRPNTKTENNVKIGNFVEVKNSTINQNTKASHLAYIGDADIGENVNIGCGAIFVNYNGKSKSRTTVGKNSFVGSNCNLIAPLKIGDYSYICAGTTVTDDTEKFDFVIGRQRQIVKKNLSLKYLKKE